MKSELLIILALAAALAFHRSPESPACGSAGCCLVPPDFQKSMESFRAKTAAQRGVDAGGELR